MSQLFQGKSESYEKYRPKFPTELFEFLEFQIGLDLQSPKSRLMDLGCGTGNLTFKRKRKFGFDWLLSKFFRRRYS